MIDNLMQITMNIEDVTLQLYSIPWSNHCINMAHDGSRFLFNNSILHSASQTATLLVYDILG